ncbi:MAG: site-specific integrase [Rhizobium sp.]|nr:site-specific integrase [Rhizobium sp.]
MDRLFPRPPSQRRFRSRHSLRAYGYDVRRLAFSFEARAKAMMGQADRHDVLAYHPASGAARDAGQRISAASWNRAVACLDRLYRWGMQEGLIAEAPFTHRSIWRQGHAGRRSQVAARNDAYEPAARRANVSFATLEDYRRFRDVGLKALLPDGHARPGGRDRNGIRNALFSDLLVTTGLRLEEAPPSSPPILFSPITVPAVRSGWICRMPRPRVIAAARFPFPLDCSSRCAPMSMSNVLMPSRSSSNALRGGRSTDRSSFIGIAMLPGRWLR